jgi:hypothetical protein
MIQYTHTVDNLQVYGLMLPWQTQTVTYSMLKQCYPQLFQKPNTVCMLESYRTINGVVTQQRVLTGERLDAILYKLNWNRVGGWELKTLTEDEF